jgi:hypothetical protein
MKLVPGALKFLLAWSSVRGRERQIDWTNTIAVLCSAVTVTLVVMYLALKGNAVILH